MKKITISVLLLFSTVIKAKDYQENSNNFKKQPFKLETLTETKNNDYHKFNKSYLPSKMLSNKEIFDKFIDCYPTKSGFEFSLKASTGYKSYNSSDTGQDRFYGGIVATMPLFSTSENYRAKEQEAHRRQNLAKLIAGLLSDITKRNLAIRKIALYESLERREQLRISKGLSLVSDQIALLEKIASEYQNKDEAITDIEGAKLQLLAVCTKDKYIQLDKYISQIIDEMD